MSRSSGRSCARSRHSSCPPSGDASPSAVLSIICSTSPSYIKKNFLTGSLVRNRQESYSPAKRVLWSGTRVTCERVSDGSGRFILAGIVGFHTLSLLLAPQVAHDRATEDDHTHHTGRVSYTNINEGTNTNEHYRTQLVGTVHKYRRHEGVRWSRPHL